MVERFNGRTSEIFATIHFDASRDLHETLHQYQKFYKPHIPQKNPGHIFPFRHSSNGKKTTITIQKNIYDHSIPDNKN